MVPRLRVWACPTQGSAAASSGCFCASAGQDSNAAWRTRGADADDFVVGLDIRKLRQVHDVDQDLGPRHAHRQHRHKTLSAGDDAGVLAFGC